MKQEWTSSLKDAAQLVDRLPPDHAGCIYVDESTGEITEPTPDLSGLKPHFGSLGGTLPQII